MLNRIRVKIYGNDRVKIFENLKEYSQFPSSPISAYSNTYIQDTLNRFNGLIVFLKNTQKSLKNIDYKIFYEEKLYFKYMLDDNPHLINSRYYIFNCMSVINFNPCDLTDISSTYFSTDSRSQQGIIKQTGSVNNVFDFDLDGILYAHHTVVEKIMSSGLKGMEFMKINSTDNELYSYRNESKKEDLDLLEKSPDWTIDRENSMFYITREAFDRGAKNRLLGELYKMNKSYGASSRDAMLIPEFTPPQNDRFTKWMAVEIPLIQGLESEKCEYTTQDRICPVTGKVFPLLTSQLYLKEKTVPQDLDFFRTENGHFIISKKAFDFFNRKIFTGSMDRLGEPVLLV